jgi:hypothetical protein
VKRVFRDLGLGISRSGKAEKSGNAVEMLQRGIESKELFLSFNEVRKSCGRWL